MKINDLFQEGSFTLDSHVLDGIAELNALKGCQQNQKYHEEGDAFVHTKMCVNAVCSYVPEMATLGYSDMTIKCIIASVLFHDIGKAVTESIKDGVYHSYGHEFASERMVRRLLWDEEIQYREKVCGLVRNHMMPLSVISGKHVLENIARLSLSNYYSLGELYFVKKADIEGTINNFKDKDKTDIEIFRRLTRQLGGEVFPCFDTNIEIHKNNPYETFVRKILFNEEIHRDSYEVTIHFMIGLPGSGKSTALSRLLHSDAVVISRDIVRAELGYCKNGEKVVLSKELEDNVSEICNRKLLVAVKDKKEVIIDNMNTKKKYRDAIKNLLTTTYPKVNFKYHYVYCETSLENNMKRRDMISKDVFESMITSIDWPLPEEYHWLDIVKS